MLHGGGLSEYVCVFVCVCILNKRGGTGNVQVRWFLVWCDENVDVL
jgi:hypothetical protein